MSPRLQTLLVALGFALGAAVSAYASYQVTMRAIPGIIMQTSLDRITASQGTNTWIHTPRPTAKSRAVVRPSPDLFYSACVYDLTESPVEILVQPSPGKHYWSLSLFDADTNNFFTRNDLAAGGAPIRVILTESQAQADACGPDAMASPTPTGLALIRRLAPDNTEAVGEVRAGDVCRAVVPPDCSSTTE